jgi:tRNA threonylcarbamoyladenosine biosynthesis protein TsaB
MKLFAIETSTMLGGIAVIDDSAGLIAEARLNVKSTHSERLMTEIDHIMKHSGVKLSDIDAFAISIGPGSFTGLRIGLSTVKGFAFATGRPIVAVPTLEALAWNFPYCRYPVCTMFDARKKEVYAALFYWEGNGFVRLLEEMSVKVDDLTETVRARFLTENEQEVSQAPNLSLPAGGNCEGDLKSGLCRGKGNGRFSHENILFIGEGALLYKDRILETFKEKAILPPPDRMAPSPANVAAIGMQKALRGEFSEPISLIPFYVRRSEAEIKRNS